MPTEQKDQDPLNKTWSQDQPRYSDESVQSTALHRAAEKERADGKLDRQTGRTVATGALLIPAIWLLAAGILHGNIALLIGCAAWLVLWAAIVWRLWRR